MSVIMRAWAINDPVEAENYQILIPVAGRMASNVRANANEGEIQGFHAVITDACKYPEALSAWSMSSSDDD